MDKNFWDRVKEKAYLNYINRNNAHLDGNLETDWDGAKIDAMLEEKIEKEAYMNFLRYGDNPEYNWERAKADVFERINFLAYHVHEKKYNQKPIDNWKEAEKIYIENF